MTSRGPPWLWHPSFAALHPPPAEGSTLEGEEEQTFAAFVNSGTRLPNVRGTGRNKVVRPRTQFAVLPIGDVPASLACAVAELLGAFFGNLLPPVDVLPGLKLVYGKTTTATLHLGTSSSSADTGTGTRKRKRKRTRERTVTLPTSFATGDTRNTAARRAPLDIWPLFDALTQFVGPSHCALLALVAAPLVESFDDDAGGIEVADVLGRACGDRVACVSTWGEGPSSSDDDDGIVREIIATALHEVLHCIGLDHCTTFRCLMNSQQPLDPSEEYLVLSPLNLRKLLLVLKEGGHVTAANVASGTAALRRYAAMEPVLRKYGLHKDAGWVLDKVRAMETVLAS